MKFSNLDELGNIKFSNFVNFRDLFLNLKLSLQNWKISQFRFKFSQIRNFFQTYQFRQIEFICQTSKFKTSSNVDFANVVKLKFFLFWEICCF